MFSYALRRSSAARLVALVSLQCGFAATAFGQQLFPPQQYPQAQPYPAAQQYPSALQTRLAMQNTGVVQTPSGFQASDSPDGNSAGNSAPPVPGEFQAGEDKLVHRVQASSERMEMTVNSSRIITLDQKIPKIQVNNPSIVEPTILSPNEIQVFAKKAGITQINLWNEQGQVYTIDCVVYGDARALSDLLHTRFPRANLHVWPMNASVLLTGFVDRSDEITQIMQIALDFYPKVIPDIRVGGVQQVMLHVKVAEVSRTKLRSMGFDFGQINGNSFAISGIGGLISPITQQPQTGGAVSVANAANAITPTGVDTFRFGVVDSRSGFFGFLEALRKEDLLKILSDPTLTTVSGRPAYFNSGGEFPILVPQSLGTVSIDYKKFGTQLDFVPIVLGNGNIRLEVRPRVSEIDPTRSITINGTVVPGLRVREVDTGVEMKPGQTLAIAGLVQTRLDAEKREVPWLGELPYIGTAFRRVHQEEEEIELLIMVTPEIVEALDPCETPMCFPGMHSEVPDDCELYFKGYIEKPSCGPCGPNGCPAPGGPGIVGGVGPANYEEVSPGSSAPTKAVPGTPSGGSSATSTDYSARANSGTYRGGTAMRPTNQTYPQPAGATMNNRYNPPQQQTPRTTNPANTGNSGPGLIGPVGYDVLN
ncbi:MAG TPA: pilus assembly protein N-terminal domain-containing protein [Pirellulales bacterium]|jgi:pilus assembly protein CpaC